MALTVRTTGYEDYLEGGGGKIKLLLGGAPGAGKTRFSSFAPKPFYIDCEDGLMSVADRRVPYVSAKSVGDMTAILDMLDAEARKPANQQRFQTVVVDTLDAYQRIVTTEYLRRMRKDAMSGWEDWGYLDSKMTQLLARLFLLPMNVIALMHVKDTKVGDLDVTQPKLKGDMRDQIAADFDFVGLIQNRFDSVPSDKGGVERGLVREISWEPTPMAPWLKCRGGALTTTPVEFKDTDWSVIHDNIAAALKGLQGAETIGQIETEPAVEPVPVGPGGPVQGRGVTATRSSSVAKSATAAKAAPAAPAQAAPAGPAATPAAPAMKSPPPPAKAPVLPAAAPRPGEEPTEEEAIASVEKHLGGEVTATGTTDPTTGVDTPDAPAEPEEQQHAAADQAVPEPREVVDTPLPEPTAEQPAEPTGVVPTNGKATVLCGQPRWAGGTIRTAGAGCGEPIQITLVDDQIRDAGEGENPALMEISALRERAFLHNRCYGAVRAAASAK